MKFSKFGRRISDSLFILPQPGNIVKRFFNFFKEVFQVRSSPSDNSINIPRPPTIVNRFFNVFYNYFYPYINPWQCNTQQLLHYTK